MRFFKPFSKQFFLTAVVAGLSACSLAAGCANDLLLASLPVSLRQTAEEIAPLLQLPPENARIRAGLSPRVTAEELLKDAMATADYLVGKISAGMLAQQGNLFFRNEWGATPEFTDEPDRTELLWNAQFYRHMGSWIASNLIHTPTSEKKLREDVAQAANVVFVTHGSDHAPSEIHAAFPNHKRVFLVSGHEPLPQGSAFNPEVDLAVYSWGGRHDVETRSEKVIATGALLDECQTETLARIAKHSRFSGSLQIRVSLPHTSGELNSKRTRVVVPGKPSNFWTIWEQGALLENLESSFEEVDFGRRGTALNSRKSAPLASTATQEIEFEPFEQEAGAPKIVHIVYQ